MGNLGNKMPKTAELPEKYERFLDKPYGGLFGNSVQARVVEEIVADPFRDYRPKDLQELTDASAPSIANALSSLAILGLIELTSGATKHPSYRAVEDSKRLVALTLLAFSSNDDRDGTDTMDEAIAEYCTSILPQKVPPSVMTRVVQYDWRGLTYTKGDQLKVSSSQMKSDYKPIAGGA